MKTHFFVNDNLIGNGNLKRNYIVNCWCSCYINLFDLLNLVEESNTTTLNISLGLQPGPILSSEDISRTLEVIHSAVELNDPLPANLGATNTTVSESFSFEVIPYTQCECQYDLITCHVHYKSW